jgi:predicted Zn-dependent protease
VLSPDRRFGGTAIKRLRANPQTLLPALPVQPASLTTEQLPDRVLFQLDATRLAVRSFALNDAREHVELALVDAPTSFTVNAIHGEVLYRLGLYKAASAALFTALLQPPSDWANYQVVNHLYQESRARERGSFTRTTDYPPPKPIENTIRWVAARFRWMARFRKLETTA